jgi:response regulator of citrate/malate metabolism
MADWRVLIVEDDGVVASLHCRFIARTPGFAAVGVAATAAQAEEMAGNLRPDLLLLDIGLPGADGVSLLRRLRARGDPVEVIAVTADSAARTVRAVVQLGAVDYLVKPFDQDRLRKSLGLFQRRMGLLARTRLEQAEVDRICSDGPNAYRWLPKDLSTRRLEEVKSALSAAGRPLTADRVGAEVGVARVTARRYLEYLVTIGQAAIEPVVDGPGRPRKTYRPVERAGQPLPGGAA